MRPRRVLKLQPKSDAVPPDVGGLDEPAVRANLTLLSRQGCHLCEDAAAVLEALAGEFDVRVAVTDIDCSDVLRSAYNEHVPVLMHGDNEICRHTLDLPALERYLATLPMPVSR